MIMLLNGLWEGAALTAAIWLLMKLIPSVNAATRYWIWWVALLVVLVLPLRGLWRQAPAGEQQLSGVNMASSSEAPDYFASDKNLPVAPVSDATETIQVPAAVAEPAANEVKHSGLHPIALAARPIWIVVAAVWVLASTILLVRLAMGYRWLTTLNRDSAPASRGLQARLDQWGNRAGVARKARLLVNDEVKTPMVLGLGQSSIVIPRGLTGQMSEGDFDHMALHELAHLQRRDDWLNLLQKVLEALMPIQPAVFWIGRQLGRERETACDNWVINVTGNPKPYAASLTRIAELTLWARCNVLASGALGHPSQLYRRVHSLLDATRNRSPRVRATPLAVAMGAMIALVWGFGLMPPVIALADSTPGTAPGTRNSPAPADAAKTADASGSATGAKGAMTTAPTVSQGDPTMTSPQTFAVEEGDKLIVDLDKGNVQVSAWDRKSAEITLKKSAGLGDFIQQHQVTFSQKGHEVSIHSSAPTGPDSRDGEDGNITYIIHVPVTFDANIATKLGNLLVSDVKGNVEVSSSNGNIRLLKIEGAAVASSSNGNFQGSECAGTLEVDVSQGNIQLDALEEWSVTARTAMGNISGEFSKSIAGNSALESKMGNIRVKLGKTAQINLAASTKMGRIKSELPMGAVNGGGPDLRLHSEMGNVSIEAK